MARTRNGEKISSANAVAMNQVHGKDRSAGFPVSNRSQEFADSAASTRPADPYGDKAYLASMANSRPLGSGPVPRISGSQEVYVHGIQRAK